MAKTKFIPLWNVCDDVQLLRQDFEAATQIHSIRIGENFIFIQSVLKYIYISIPDVQWAYQRKEDCSASICCGRTVFSSFFLMLVSSFGKRRVAMEQQAQVDAALDLLKKRCPSIHIGYSSELARQYH